MALIKCSECGQMVSDKASACPHCGCPVKKSMVCPECGQTVAEGDIYCQKCGSPLNQVDNNGVQTSVNPNQELGQPEIKKKSNNPLRWFIIVLATLVVLGGAISFAWQRGLFNKTLAQNDTTAVDSVALDTLPDMAAPFIELNEDGMYTVENCPTTYEGLEIIIEKNFDGAITKIEVMKDGKLNCSFSAIGDDSDNHLDSDKISFLDANFDGYVDFFIGPVCERTHSMLFLWDPSRCMFKVAKEGGNTPIFNGTYYFHPAEKKVYSRGTGGWSHTFYIRSSWIGDRLFMEEYFSEEFLHSFYNESQPNRYVIYNHSEEIILSTDDPQKIPARWEKWAYVPTPEEEKHYAETDAQVYSAEESYPANDESEIEEVKSWIQGNWRGRSGSMIVDVAIGENMAVLWNGELYYRGPYSIEGNKIIFNRRNGSSDYVIIDKEHKQLKLSENEPMIRM